MKYKVVPGIVVLAVAALLVVVSSAVATTVTSPTGTVYTGNIKVVTSGHAILHNDIASIECNVTLEGPVESHGVGTTVEGQATTVNMSSCTQGWIVDTVNKGKIIAHWTSGYRGVLTSTGTTAIATRFGVSCGYLTNQTTIGTFTGGNPASLHLEMSVPRHSGSFLCGGSTATLTGTGSSTPSAIYLDQ